MELLEIWGDLILPSRSFALQDAWQLGFIAILVISTSFLAKRFKVKGSEEETAPSIWTRRNSGYLIAWLITTILAVILSQFELSISFLRFFAFLGGLWIGVGLLCSFFKDRFWARSVAFVIYVVTALNAISYSAGSLEVLKEVKFSLGSLSISAWGVAAGLFAFVLALWVSLGVAHIIENRVKDLRRLSPSLRVLIVKIVRIIFIIIASMVALSSMGIDLSSLTVLGGAIGLGLGFGLQKVVSNFVSGVILLLDNSIKPGDVIEIDQTYGWVNNLRARYASVITRDGTEHLIPNEDLITQRVINWSFTDKLVRMKVPIGVSYKEDPHECIRLILDAASSHDRVLDKPSPVCLLKGFGDSSIKLELRFWIGDPANGVSNIKSRVLLAVWDTFKENNIEIPYPQRDLHIRSSDVDLVDRNSPDPD